MYHAFLYLAGVHRLGKILGDDLRNEVDTGPEFT